MDEYVPELQFWKTVAPFMPEYVPAGQFRQKDANDAPTVVEYVPAKQTLQLVARLTPAVLDQVPALQPIHVLIDVAPSRLDHVPAWHGVHMLAPVSDHVPPRQVTHADKLVASLLRDAVPAGH